MTNPYRAITTYEGLDWQPFLTELGLWEIFDGLFAYYASPGLTTKVIRYIAWAYSEQSEKIITGMDWQENKRKIFDLAGLPGTLWEPIGRLTDPNVVKTIHKWLDLQGGKAFIQLQSIKDLAMEMRIASNTDIRKANNEVDYDQKRRNATYARELDEQAQELESELIQNSPRLKETVKEAKYVRKRQTTGPEEFAK